jgi:hypothetical protein
LSLAINQSLLLLNCLERFERQSNEIENRLKRTPKSTEPDFCKWLLEAVLKPGSVDFRALLSQFSILLRGVIYELILPLAREWKSGQNGSENLRTQVLRQLLRSHLQKSGSYIR